MYGTWVSSIALDECSCVGVRNDQVHVYCIQRFDMQIKPFGYYALCDLVGWGVGGGGMHGVCMCGCMYLCMDPTAHNISTQPQRTYLFYCKQGRIYFHLKNKETNV